MIILAIATIAAVVTIAIAIIIEAYDYIMIRWCQNDDNVLLLLWLSNDHKYFEYTTLEKSRSLDL